MKRSFVILALISGILSLNAVSLRIFHTNDTHGAYLPQRVTIGDSTGFAGGYANLEYALNQERSVVPRSIYLDAGDQQTGSIFSSLEYHGAIGGAVIEAFNYLKLDACTYGNHEFDQTQENTLKLSKLANYPFVSTNLLSAEGTSFSGVPYRIIAHDSLNIGIMGLTMLDLSEKVKRENVANLTILSYQDAINQYLDELDAKTDLIVLLTHIGLDADSLLATTLDQRVDLIIGGHSHDTVSEPYQVNGIYIASAGSYLNALGIIDVEVQDDRIVAYTSQILPLLSPNPRPPEEYSSPLSSFVASIADSLEQEMNTVIAHLPQDWIPNKFAETELSKWAAWALFRDYQDTLKPDLAIINCGGLRKSIPAGPVTQRDMHELMPFNNYVVLFSCYGRDLLTMAELNKHIALAQPYDIVQTANAGWTAGSQDGKQNLKPAYLVGNKPLNPDIAYRVISHDYLVGQWDKYLGFKPFGIVETGDLILDSAIRQIKLQYGP